MMEQRGEETAGRHGASVRLAFRHDRKSWFVAAAALVLLGYAAQWLYHRYTHVYIDDARIDGEVITFSSRVAGWVTELPVIEGDMVRKGQVIARIDDRDARLRRDALVAKLNAIEGQMNTLRAQSGQVDQETLGKLESETQRLSAARAAVAALEVQVKQTHDDARRAEDLHKQRWISQQAMEQARTAYQHTKESHRKAQAEVAAVEGAIAAASGSRRQVQVLQRQYLVLAAQANEMRAEIRRQEVDIADRTIVSPADGRIVMTFVRKGEHVAVGQRILMFHDPDEIWVEANVKETAVGLLKPGMKASVKVDAYRDRTYDAKVFRIGQAATSKFALLPDPNPSGNFTKITQRLPVRLLFDEKDPALRPGMMVEVAVAVRDH
ncbi:MAG: HlyD family secretion protein [Rhodospirillaceae bacterium]